jgi:hypothetical protein
MIEVLVAAVLLMVGVLAMLSVLDLANATTTSNRARDVATSVTRQVTEGARSIPYSALTPQTIESQLQSQPGLAAESGGNGWTIRRNGVDFSVTATVCAVDDPSDGTGAHDAGVHCTDSGAPGSADRNPDDYKRITVDLTWTVDGRERTMHQSAVVNHPGSADGPAVNGLTIAQPAGALITSILSGVSFAATTSRPAAAVTFSVDGVATSTATGAASLWNLLWPIADLDDGTHLVTAQAFDAQGLSGATRSATVTLNRFAPFAPTGLAGGRNGSTVELEWLPNSERDIAGYRAYRGLPVLGQQVCALTRKFSCVDDNPPGGLLGLVLTYYVVAVDLSPSGQYRDGLPSLPSTVLTTNHPPFAPTGLSATRDGDETTLTWTAPSPADEDHEPIAFYRIYRDGSARENRYDRTGFGTETSIVDGRADGTTHSYWVTAVDSQLAESARIGPVTL